MDKNEVFGAKNKRIVKAIRNMQPYWLLITGNNWHYALIQIKSDKIPVPVLLKLFEKDENCENLEEAFGYDPEVILDRDVKLAKSDDLLLDIVRTMMISANGRQKPRCFVDKNEGIVYSGFPEDSLKNNGFYCYRRYYVIPQGVVAEDDWSCGFSEYGDKSQTLFKTNIDDIAPLFVRAETIVMRGKGIRICPMCGHQYSHESN